MNHKSCRKQSRQNQRIRRKQYVLQYKSSHPCMLCCETTIDLLTFHHRRPKDKITDICKIVTSGGMAKLKKEIDKCDIMCQTCHKKIHNIHIKEVNND